MDMKSTGSLIAAKRSELGLTQYELADIIGVSDKVLSKWEEGLSCPDADMLTPLTSALNITIYDLISGNPSDNASEYSISSDTASYDDENVFSSDEVITETTPADTVVSPLMFGSNLEHTRSDVISGISAQMLKNRKFAGKPSRYSGVPIKWFAIGQRVFYNQDASYTRHCSTYHMHRAHECASWNIVNFINGEPAGLGQSEIPVFAGKDYEFRIVVKSVEKFTLYIELTSRGGKKVYSSTSINTDAPDWETYSCILTPDTTDNDAEIRIYFLDNISINIGAVSLMPSDNFHGMRKDVIECLRDMGVSILRWPGGNFAGEYCWEDGLMPSEMRAPLESYLHLETQPHSMCYDYHEINTDDFVALCREIGAQPFITINLSWNTPEENANWVEYCNGDENTKYGKLRIERGFREPYNVKFWSLGNEMGYGHMEGDNTIAGYLKAASPNADAMLSKTPDLILTSSGPYPNSDWWKNCAEKMSDRVNLVSMHHYSPSPSYKNKEGARDEYYRVLHDIEGHIRPDVYRMHNDLGNNCKISFDEWNIWYAWYHQSNIYNGIFSALFMHMIFEEAEKCGIGVVCHFEAVNEGMIEVFDDHAELTAAGQIMSAMKYHRCGQIIHASRFAAVTKKENEYTATLINASFDRSKKFVTPEYTDDYDGSLYFGEKMEPCSKFLEKDITLTKTDSGLEIIVPAHSVVLIRFKA